MSRTKKNMWGKLHAQGEIAKAMIKNLENSNKSTGKSCTLSSIDTVNKWYIEMVYN